MESENKNSEPRKLDLIDVREVSELTQIPIPTIYKMIKEKRIPHYKLGSYKFDRKEIMRWIESNYSPDGLSNSKPTTPNKEAV